MQHDRAEEVLRGVLDGGDQPRQLHHRLHHRRRVQPAQAHRRRLRHLRPQLRAHRQLRRVLRAGSDDGAEDALAQRQARRLFAVDVFFQLEPAVSGLLREKFAVFLEIAARRPHCV